MDDGTDCSSHALVLPSSDPGAGTADGAQAATSADAGPDLLVATMMGVVLVTLDVLVVNVAVESMRESLGVGISGLQWVLNVYTLTYAVFLLSAGALVDHIGARSTFLIGFLVFTASSMACGLAPSFQALLAARLVPLHRGFDELIPPWS